MGRTARIWLKNETGGTLTFVKDKLEHGKFTTRPPAQIPAGEMGEFRVANNDSDGPKGKLTYQGTINGKPGQISVFWDHPFNDTTSVYQVGSNPTGQIRYSLAPAIPVGQDQTIMISIGLLN